MAPRSRYRLITDEVRALRLIREDKGLSVNKAAPLIGTNKSTLTALENGRINLSERWIEKILRGYRTERKTFESIKEQRLSSKEALLKEIRHEASKLSYEKLVMIRQLVLGFLQ
jgi:DNA-binding XRE family transcriptional regulator